MGRQFRRRRSGDPIELGKPADDDWGWEMDRSSVKSSISTDERMTAMVSACTHPDFHGSKNSKAGGATVASHSTENVGHAIKRSLSFLELVPELFGDDSSRTKTNRRKQAAIVAMATVLFITSAVIFIGSAEEEAMMIEQHEIDFGDHKKSLKQVAHATAKYLQKSQITREQTVAKDRPLSSRASSQNASMKQHPVPRTAERDIDEDVRDEDRQNFVNAHKVTIVPEVVDTSRPLRAIPQDAQIRSVNVIGPPIQLDEVNSNLKYVLPISEKYDPSSDDEIPLFWEMSGGKVGRLLRNVLSCRNTVLASGEGVSGENGNSDTVQEVTIEGRRYVNVGTDTVAGLRRAKDLGLASSDLADVIFTPLFHPALQMFDASNHKARAFSTLRNPIERSISTFLVLRDNNDPAVAGMSLEQYAQSPLLESNWMVRTLSGNMDSELMPQHLDVAQEILANNFIVGLYDDRYGSISRFETFFGWEYNDEQSACRSAMLQEEMSRHDMAKQLYNEGGKAIELLWKENALDMQLYDFTDALYKDQAGLFADMQ